jgi:hypothetical protein
LRFTSARATTAFRNPKIKCRVVPDEYRPRAPLRMQRVAHFAKHSLQGVALGKRRAQRVEGIDAIDLERRRIEVRAVVGLHVEAVRGAAHETAVGGDVDEYRRNLQERIRAGIKSTRFDVDDHWQKAAKAP